MAVPIVSFHSSRGNHRAQLSWAGSALLAAGRTRLVHHFNTSCRRADVTKWEL